MAEGTVQMNIAVLPETKALIEQIGKLTFRGKGDVIDWVVSEAWCRMEAVRIGRASVVEALEAIGPEGDRKSGSNGEGEVIVEPVYEDWIEGAG
jgi:hypothetical protein